VRRLIELLSYCSGGYQILHWISNIYETQLKRVRFVIFGISSIFLMVVDNFTGINEHPSPSKLSFILFKEYMNPYIMLARRSMNQI
jgi:hypothetical protein